MSEVLNVTAVAPVYETVYVTGPALVRATEGEPIDIVALKAGADNAITAMMIAIR
jgi:hypothetical protein